MAYTEYVLQDRADANKWAVKVTDAQLFIELSVASASAEPIFEDDINAGTYWKLFVNAGELGIESTVTVQDDDITLIDSLTAIEYRLAVEDAKLLMNPGSIPVVAGVFGLIRRRRR